MNALSEGEVVCLWQRQARTGAVLTTAGGEPVEIIYPGRINDGQGADFRDAVVSVGGRLLKGDIEVHVRSSDWQAHRHHRDVAYERVVLHVVMRDDSRTATCLRNGGSVPVVSLDRCSGADTPRASGHMACAGMAQTGGRDRLVEILDVAGEARFLAKVAGFRGDVDRMGAGQALYRGVMGALGYAGNKLPFLRLAERLPLDRLERGAREAATEEECLAWLQSRLLGTAGLLPSQRWGGQRRDGLDDACVATLEELWASAGTAIGETGVMSPEVWHLSGVRPHNSPVRRLVAMSHLVHRYRERGMLDGLLGETAEESLSSGGPRRLEEVLMVAAHGYWASRSDFGRGSRTDSPTLLGRPRASDIVVNVLLPFAFAWARSGRGPDQAAAALAVYRRYPILSANVLERHMRAQLGVVDGLIGSARQQQGLIHIYESRCTQGRCQVCELKSGLERPRSQPSFTRV